FREANSDVPVIVVSPRPKLDEAVSLVRGHAYDYLDRKDLWDDLDRCLDRAIAEKGYTLSREEQLDVTLGERLRAARKANDLTLQQLATRAGVSVSLISQIELARSSGSVRTLFKLSRALGVPLEGLFADY
ncbi:MAG: helix-turn-helix transcriptional regulator, partial [Planctomycetota bacterium]